MTSKRVVNSWVKLDAQTERVIKLRGLLRRKSLTVKRRTSLRAEFKKAHAKWGAMLVRHYDYLAE